MTKPTTIRAITDIPAKTPRPIGRTESFFPGSWNASVDCDACSAAAADAPDADAEASGAAVPAFVSVPEGGAVVVGFAAVEPPPADVVGIAVWVGVPVTVDTP